MLRTVCHWRLCFYNLFMIGESPDLSRTTVPEQGRNLHRIEILDLVLFDVFFYLIRVQTNGNGFKMCDKGKTLTRKMI